jgi:hypothetical protein
MGTRSILIAQGVYYAATGVAPFLSRRAFEAVTGPKRDWWLVQTVGAVVAPIGAGLIAAGVSGRATPELQGIAAGSAAGLAGIDVFHAARGTISRVYLLDAALQAALLAALARTTWRASDR